MKNLKKYRLKAELTQSELAEKVGCVRTVITNAEKGRYNLSLPTAQKVATALGVSIDELLKQ